MFSTFDWPRKGGSLHHDLRRFLYRVEVDKTFDVVEELRKLSKVEEQVALQTGSLLHYRNGNYEAKLLLTGNVLVGKVVGKSPIITDATHRILFWRRNSVDYAGANGSALDTKNVEKHCGETRSCSFRATQIAKTLGLVAGTLDWQTDFMTSDGKNLKDCSEDLTW